ncbi:hypothetical protein [Serratia fonticola]|uniref:hypothetical protein n=1 Tax=Serratia fonticola TaxID=47917 RepID=UPI003BB60AC8
MKQPFYEASNAVIKMYAWRQERASAKCPAHSPSEIDWAADRLLDLALAASYVSSNEAIAIRDMAEFWKRNKHLRVTPALFPLESAEVPA